MCVPALVGLAITAASAAAQYSAQNSAAKANAAGIKQTNDLQQMDLQRQADQQYEAGAQQANDHARRAMHDAALFDTVAGEYGVGNSVDRTSAVAGVQTGEQLATISRNTDMLAQENRFASLATTTGTNAKLASIQYPSKVGLGLSIAGAYVKAKTPQWLDEQDYARQVETWRAGQRRKNSIATMPYLQSNRSLGD